MVSQQRVPVIRNKLNPQKDPALLLGKQNGGHILKLISQLLKGDNEDGKEEANEVMEEGEQIEGLADLRMSLLKAELRGIHYRQSLTGKLYFKFTPRLVHL